MKVRLTKEHMSFRCCACGKQLPASRTSCSSTCRKEFRALKLQLKHLGTALERLASRSSFLLITAGEIYLFAQVRTGIRCHKHSKTGSCPSDSIRDLWLELNKCTKERGRAFFNEETLLPNGFLKRISNIGSKTSPSNSSWWRSLNIDFREWKINAADAVRDAYLRRAKLRHPDKGGGHDLMVDLNFAHAEAKKFLSQSARNKTEKAEKRGAWKYRKDLGWWIR